MKLFTKILPVFAFLYATSILFMFPKWTIDDAYITLRYAENLAFHDQLTWNINEDPVEGYTGVVLPVLLATTIKVGFNPIIVSKIIGIVSFFSGGLVLFFFLGKLGIHSLIRSIVILIYSSAPFMFTHATSGLETVLFSTFVITSLYLLFISLEFSKYRIHKEIMLLISLLLTSLIRPEGVVLAGISILVIGLMHFQYRKQHFLSYVIRVLILFILPSLLYFLWRWDYYGQFLPNTFYNKSYAGLVSSGTLTSLSKFMLVYISIPFMISSFLFAVDTAVSWDSIKKKNCLQSLIYSYVTGLLFLIIVTFQYFRSTLVMNFSYRFYVFFFPVLLVGISIVADVGFNTLISSRNKKPSRYRFIVPMLLLLLFSQLSLHLLLLTGRGAVVTGEIIKAAEYKQLLEYEHIPAGKYLKEAVPSTEWLIVHVDAGAIPYYSKLKTVDFGGLNDEILSKIDDLSTNEIVDYFYSFNAGAIVFTSYKWDKVEHGADDIINDPRFQQYTLVKKYRTKTGEGYYQFVFLRNDILD